MNTAVDTVVTIVHHSNNTAGDVGIMFLIWTACWYVWIVKTE